MRHEQNITDIRALKVALRKTARLDVKLEDRQREGEYWTGHGMRQCRYAIVKRDGCSLNEVDVVLNQDGTYYLEWEGQDDEVDERIMRAVQRIIAAYNKEMGNKQLKAEASKDAAYELEQSELQNKNMVETKQQPQRVKV